MFVVLPIVLGLSITIPLFVWAIRHDLERSRMQPLAVPPPVLPVARVNGARPHRWAVYAGFAWFVAAFAVFVWPDGGSDCHGSPVCGLDGLAMIGKLFIAAILVGIGALWLAVVAVVRRRPR